MGALLQDYGSYQTISFRMQMRQNCDCCRVVWQKDHYWHGTRNIYGLLCIVSVLWADLVKLCNH